LPRQIKDQMLSHIIIRFKTEELKQQEMLASLPKGVRSSIAYNLFLPIVEKTYLFNGVSSSFTFQLVQHRINDLEFLIFKFKGTSFDLITSAIGNRRKNIKYKPN
jgi:hypothetical protein